MPPFPGMPYGPASFYCFPLTEVCTYILFILCFIHAVKQDVRHVSYLLGGVLFGLMLEYINVISNMGYTYGKFVVMLGNSPHTIPVSIGIGWAIIMYSAGLFSDSFQISLWPAAAVDSLLAISIDFSMDAVAYRLHMWHWNWEGSGHNPLTADWFGIPFGNFFGWLMVVFFYSSISRLLERTFLYHKKAGIFKFALVPLLSVLLSQVLLYIMLVYVNKFLYDHFHITRLHLFVSFLIVLSVLTIRGMRKRKANQVAQPVVTWLVPVWFHLFFFAWLFIGGFYNENVWLIIAATLNMLIGIGIHFLSLKKRPVTKPFTIQAA